MYDKEDARYVCVECFGYIAPARYRLGYKVCLECGEVQARQAKHTIAPLNKSNYIHISDLSQLKQLNPKRTT